MHYAINNTTAANDGNFELENMLISSGVSLNAKDALGRTPLHYAFVKMGTFFDYTPSDPIEVVTSLCAQVMVIPTHQNQHHHINTPSHAFFKSPHSYDTAY